MKKYDIQDLYYGFLHWKLIRSDTGWCWVFFKPFNNNTEFEMGDMQGSCSREEHFLDRYYIGSR